MSKFQRYIYFIGIILLSIIYGIDSQAVNSKGEFTVVIDAGHGGKDTGAKENGKEEKNINLGVAKELESLIKKKLKNVNVVMTRDKDVYLTLQQRADIANSSKGDLFISIHTNSVDLKSKNRKTVNGSSVYALGLHKDANNMEVARRENSVIELEIDYEQKYSGFDPSKDESYIIFEMAQKKNLSKSIKFAEDVQKELVNAGRSDRGVHQAGFWVLWATSMPSVLVELDFICNPVSAQYISSEKGSKELAQAIFNAFEKYYDGWLRNEETMSADLKSTKKGVKVDNLVFEEQDNYESENNQSYPVANTRKHKEKINQTTTQNKKNKNSTGRKRRTKTNKTEEVVSYETDFIPVSNNEIEESSEVLPTILDNSEDAKKALKNRQKEEKRLAEQKKKEEKRLEAQRKKEERKKERAQKKERDKNRHSAKISKMQTVYKILVLSSPDKVDKKDPRFGGLSPLYVVKENGTYKYLYGEQTNLSEIEILLKEVRKRVPDAQIVTIKIDKK